MLKVTLIPHEVAKRNDLLGDVVWFKPDKALEVNDVGGKGKFLGMISKLPIILGSGVINTMVGIIDYGKFDLLLGNGTTSEFQISIDLASRSYYY